LPQQQQSINSKIEWKEKELQEDEEELKSEKEPEGHVEE
jgi:hypothetical protein